MLLSDCRKHFKKDIAEEPPNVNSRKELSIWFCRMHNRVNEQLGKPIFDCDYDKLNLRWHSNSGNCDQPYTPYYPDVEE